MPLKLERTDERLTRHAGLILVNRFGDSINLASAIDRAFGAPGSPKRRAGSNRGFAASQFILTLVEMMIDGATSLEDVRLFEHDEAYKEMIESGHYPTSDALGDWLRRHGDRDGEERLWTVIASLIRTISGGSGLTLDIDPWGVVGLWRRSCTPLYCLMSMTSRTFCKTSSCEYGF